MLEQLTHNTNAMYQLQDPLGLHGDPSVHVLLPYWWQGELCRDTFTIPRGSVRGFGQLSILLQCGQST